MPRKRKITLSLFDLQKMFPDEETSEQWFIDKRWNGHIHCPKCGSLNVKERVNRKPRSWRCREKECRKDFSVKTDTIMHNSKISFQKWAMALYLHRTNMIGVSSIKLGHDLEIQQHHTWHLIKRIQFAEKEDLDMFEGTVEADEMFVGGIEKYKHNDKKHKNGKIIVAGLKHRETGKVVLRVVPSRKKADLHKFIKEHVAKGSTLHTDELKSYKDVEGMNHESVNHSSGEYVRYKDLEKIHTNGLERIWSEVRRSYHGTYRYMSAKHLDYYLIEISDRMNNRKVDMEDQLADIVHRMNGKKLPYKELIKEAA